MSIINEAWNRNGAHLRLHADDEHSDFVTVHATRLTILSRTELHIAHRDSLCDDDELPALLRCQAE